MKRLFRCKSAFSRGRVNQCFYEEEIAAFNCYYLIIESDDIGTIMCIQ